MRAAGDHVQLGQARLELVHGQPGGVDDPIGDLPQMGHGLALGANGLQHVAILVPQRMATTCLVEAADERLLAAPPGRAPPPDGRGS